MTVGVARQHAGITGQVENCQTVVFAAYVTARGHAHGVPGPHGSGPLLGDPLVRRWLQGPPRLQLGLGGDGLTPPPRADPPQPVRPV
jgi:hypothetical protein